tara:strand:+ start:567 stop:806 length:240 start_codon:yes stop_codon:yes gene_type:complete
MPNYPGFYRKQYPIKRLKLVQLHYTKANSTEVSTMNKQADTRVLLNNPFEYFMYSVLMTIWFGGYVRRVIYNLTKKIYK